MSSKDKLPPNKGDFLERKLGVVAKHNIRSSARVYTTDQEGSSKAKRMLVWLTNSQKLLEARRHPSKYRSLVQIYTETLAKEASGSMLLKTLRSTTKCSLIN